MNEGTNPLRGEVGDTVAQTFRRGHVLFMGLDLLADKYARDNNLTIRSVAEQVSERLLAVDELATAQNARMAT